MSDWVKLRNTQNEQMSSALPSTADVGLARKGVTQIDGVVAFDRLLKMEIRCYGTSMSALPQRALLASWAGRFAYCLGVN
jgi:hypothetical protein